MDSLTFLYCKLFVIKVSKNGGGEDNEKINPIAMLCDANKYFCSAKKLCFY